MGDKSGKAKTRLDQIAGQIKDPNASEDAESRRRSKSRRSRRSSTALPADYSDVLDQLKTMKTIANTPNTSDRGYIRQKQAGKMWARERVEKFVVPGSWREIGSVAGTTSWRKDTSNPEREHVDEFLPSNNPQGLATVMTPKGERSVYLTADDFSLRAGHADGSVGPRTRYCEKLALQLRIPVVKFVDGSSGGGSVSKISELGHAPIPQAVMLREAAQQLNLGIPNLGAALGPAIGLGAARVVSTHFSVMAADIGSMFNAGPKVVQKATLEEGLTVADLGGPAIHCTNGTFDNVAQNEEDCFTQIRTVLSYLPDCGAMQAPPVSTSVDPADREDLQLRTVVPRKRSRMYNPYTIITTVVDKDSWFEIGPLWGRTAICGLARLDGHPVGIISSNCEVGGGALDAAGSQKLMKHVKLCDVMNLPILQFVDVPGYAIGTVAERTATMKWGVALAGAYYTSTTPILSVITRKVFGVAGAVMVDNRDTNMRVAWPSSAWGSLPLEGGIEVGHRYELAQIEKKEGKEAMQARYNELEQDYLRLMNPVRSANAFDIEEIIDPKDTRKIACGWARRMYGLVMEERIDARKSGRISPVFT